jgi:acetyl esterase/lipase
MKILFKTFYILVILSTYTLSQNEVIKIWNNLAPGTENKQNNEKTVDGSVTDVYQPDLTVFLPVKSDSNYPAILIFPGGGYTHLAIVKEGYKIAKWLNDNGIAAFVLKYRLNMEDALEDAQRALSYVRTNAKQFGINPDKIGVMGFSAGGHLAVNLSTHFIKNIMNDNIDSVSCKPDFQILVYGYLIDTFLKDLTKDNPPAFLVHAADDQRVNVELSVNYFLALKKLGVPVEMHIYEQGKHGFALEKDRGPVVNWAKCCIDWLKLRGILSGK